MNKVFFAWQELKKLLVDMQDGTHAERVEAYPPKVLMTDGNGSYARLRVDVGQTGFFAGREFRVLEELSIASGATQVLKIVSPINSILYAFGVELTLSQLRVELVAGGTESGAFSSVITPFKTNQMTTASSYTSQVTFATGGSHTGGTVIDAFDIVSGSNVNKAIVQQVDENQPLGFSAGTYYIRMHNTDGATANGFLKLRYEERP